MRHIRGGFSLVEMMVVLLIVSVLLMIASALLFAALFSTLLGLDFLAVLLAFAPGGVTEMCLIAVALAIDPVFVAAHHIVRIMFIMIAGPLLGRALNPVSEPLD